MYYKHIKISRTKVNLIAMAIIEAESLSKKFFGEEKPIEVGEPKTEIATPTTSTYEHKPVITEQDVQRWKETGQKLSELWSKIVERAQTKDIRAMERELEKLKHVKELDEKRRELESEIVAIQTRRGTSTLKETV